MAVTLGNGNITFGDGTVIETSAMVKSIQKGTTAGAGNVTISSIDVSKSVIMSSSKGSAGSVAASGTLNLPPQCLQMSGQSVCLSSGTISLGCQATCVSASDINCYACVCNWGSSSSAQGKYIVRCTNFSPMCSATAVDVPYPAGSYSCGSYGGVYGRLTILGISCSTSLYQEVSGTPGCSSAQSGSLTSVAGCAAAVGGTLCSCSSGSITGGSTSLTAKQYSAYIVNATTIYADGPVEWQVIEYY